MLLCNHGMLLHFYCVSTCVHLSISPLGISSTVATLMRNSIHEIHKSSGRELYQSCVHFRSSSSFFGAIDLVGIFMITTALSVIYYWRCFCSCCERENALQEAATAPGSHHVMVPSVTFFDVPHSTMTNNEEQIALLPDGGGRGHGSI